MAGAEPVAVPVLLYHRVGDERYPSTNVTLAAFREQMQWLQDQNFRVIATSQLEEHLLRGAPLPEKPVVLHFDDGFRSVYQHALPVLRRFAYPFTVFIQGAVLAGGYQDYLTPAMIDEIRQQGGDFGAHGQDHLRLGTEEVATDPGRQRLLREIHGGKAAWRERGVEVRWLAYPYGEYTDAVLQETERAGFSLAFSQDPGTAGRGVHPHRIPRYAVVGDLADLAVFRERLGYRPLVATQVRPPPGLVSADFDGVVELQLPAAGKYVAGSLNLFVSEHGRLDAHWDRASGTVRVQVPMPLRRRLNRVLVSLREADSGRYALTSWLLLTPAPRR